MLIKSTTTTEGEIKRKKSKKIYRTSQNIRIINVFSWVTAVRVLSLTGTHSPLDLPRMSSNTVLISGPAVRAAQILICSYSSVFLPPMFTAIRTSAFSLVGALNDLLYISQTQSLPSWSCGFNLQLVQMVGVFWIFFLSHTAPGFQLVLFPPLDMGCLLGFAHEAAMEDLGLPIWGPGVEVVQLLEFHGFWQHQVLGSW